MGSHHNSLVLSVKGLSATLGGREVLKDVHFEAMENEITVIMGASGSGKSTILKHLIGLYSTPPGHIQVFDRDLATLDEDDRTDLYQKMGVLYQNGALLNSMRVSENVALPLQQHTRLPKTIIRELVQLKLRLVNLEEAYHLYPRQLSGGMRKRAALARAIVMDPMILFCDEPGSGLDPVSLSSLDDLILRLKKVLGMTVIMVSHQLQTIERLADRIIFLANGQIAFQGSLSDASASDDQALKAFFKSQKTRSA